MSDSSDDMEAWSGFCDEDDSDYDDIEGRVAEAIEYLIKHCEYMWAAKTISILLKCDFRDSKEVATNFLRIYHDK